MLWETQQSRMWKGKDQKRWGEASLHFKKANVGLIEKGTFEQRSAGSEEGAPAVSQESVGRSAQLSGWPGGKVQGERA